MHSAPSDEDPATGTNMCNLLSELDHEFTRQDMDNFITRVVNVKGRSTIYRHHFFEDRHTLSRLLTQQLERCGSPLLHFPDGSLIWWDDVPVSRHVHPVNPPYDRRTAFLSLLAD